MPQLPAVHHLPAVAQLRLWMLWDLPDAAIGQGAHQAAASATQHSLHALREHSHRRDCLLRGGVQLAELPNLPDHPISPQEFC